MSGPAGSDPPSPNPAETTGAPTERYVALGDSYTAGPLVPVTEVASGCFRSNGNYPTLLAERLDLELTDVSCSGATTRDLTRRQRTMQDTAVPPQVAALDEETSLVTVGIGGNDFNLFTDLVQTCMGARGQDPGGAPCETVLAGRASPPDELLGDIGDNVEGALRTVLERAPEARVVLVGYPRIAPTSGTCPRRLPFADGDVGLADRIVRDLNDELRDAAAATGVEYLDLYAASRGHDACSDRPWVNGRLADDRSAAPFHPYPRGMRGAADALEDLLATP
jgi:lysophospholipase L1-like esterase